MDFESAVERVKSSVAKVSDDVKLRLYALYKQATCGPCETPQPWAIQVVERAKWNAWKSLGSMDRETAKTQYCVLANKL
jgi:peroxisomal 3,2-trans-enoyl-CoA isomerase